MITCPHCSHLEHIKPGSLFWVTVKGTTGDNRYVCNTCGAPCPDDPTPPTIPFDMGQARLIGAIIGGLLCIVCISLVVATPAQVSTPKSVVSDSPEPTTQVDQVITLYSLLENYREEVYTHCVSQGNSNCAQWSKACTKWLGLGKGPWSCMGGDDMKSFHDSHERIEQVMSCMAGDTLTLHIPTGSLFTFEACSAAYTDWKERIEKERAESIAKTMPKKKTPPSLSKPQRVTEDLYSDRK